MLFVSNDHLLKRRQQLISLSQKQEEMASGDRQTSEGKGNTHATPAIPVIPTIDHNHPLYLQPTDTPGTSGNTKGKKPQVICEVCGYKGHTRENCYRVVGYPPNWKGNKKGMPTQYNTSPTGTSRSYANHVDLFTTGTGLSGHNQSCRPQQIGHQISMQ